MTSEPDASRIQQMLDSGDHLRAWAWASDRFRAKTTLVNAEALRRLANGLDPERVGWLPVKVTVLRTATLEPLVPYLAAQMITDRLLPDISLEEYGVIDPLILEEGSALYASEPDVVLLAVFLQDWSPQLYWEHNRHGPKDRNAIADNLVSRIESLVDCFRGRSSAKMLLLNFAVPPFAPGGIAESVGEDSLAETVHAMNRRLAALCQRHRSVYLLDYDRLIARCGTGTWTDPKLWYLSRNPLAGPSVAHLAREMGACMRAMFGRSRKCLVLDCDDTLWGGIVGEVGLGGIALGDDYPGNAFKDFQRAVLSLFDRGVILAINSKNNEADAMEVFERHPEMILREKHIACWRVNWQDKPANMREISEDLNIGLDSLVFLDDSVIERERMRHELPEVLTVELPSSPTHYARTLAGLGVFDTLTISEDDRKRGEQYRAQVERKKLRGRSTSVVDYYRSLEMEAEIRLADERYIGRVSQLTQKTNQFNLTTRRYSEKDIEAFCKSPASRVYVLRLQDRYGDSGLVGVAIVRTEPDEWELDTFLQSCRVIGRTVETALLALICADARGSGASRVVGRYIRTKKNKPVEEFYANHGFARIEGDEEDSVWALDLRGEIPQSPSWIRIRE